MEFIADLHIHSHLSRATARNLDLEHLYLWAQLKGITVVGTGDFTHPEWFSEIRTKLEPAEPGLFKLKDEIADKVAEEVHPSCRTQVRFLLSVEISSIYKRGGRVRKVHNVVYAPDLETAEKINSRLDRIGNIHSDGRPILGLDSRDLLEIVLEASEDAFLIPAHIWTPWFSALGSKSGFDSLEECFGDLTGHIFAAETGLSSDPAMNWRVSGLDGITLVSNSDAHSPAKLGREANLFETGLSYFDIKDALKTGDPARFLGTIEFFPAEGKYHFDGHRKCGVRLSPAETRECNGICPVCGKHVTVGVMYRVEELADRREGEGPLRRHPFTSLLPLTDILSECLRVGPQSKKVQRHYHQLLRDLGPEFDILRKISAERITHAGSPLFCEAIKRMRNQDVHIAPGYDGEFGKVRLFDDDERDKFTNQQPLFQIPPSRKKISLRKLEKEPSRPAKAGKHAPPALIPKDKNHGLPASSMLNLNPLQEEAVLHVGGPFLIMAGPGTGKTRTITERIARLLSHGIARPDQVLAVTFTNKAAEEMEKRLDLRVAKQDILKHVTIRTFHGLCLDIMHQEAEALKTKDIFGILGDVDRRRLIKSLVPGGCDAQEVSDAISAAKQFLFLPEDNWEKIITGIPHNLFAGIYRGYQKVLRENLVFDFDDLILQVVRLLESSEPIRKKYQERFSFISVDEYQDINHAQYRLIRALAPPDKDICVIGDPNQAIYGFRGSDVRYFHAFQKDYPEVKSICLTQNYRSTETILKASTQVIGHTNTNGPLWSGIHGDQQITISELPTEKAEAELVVKTIEIEVGGISHFSMDSRKIDTGAGKKERGFSDFAVMFRINGQGKVLEEAFERSGIPYQRIGKERLADRKGISDILYCLRMLEALPGGMGNNGLFNSKQVDWGKSELERLKARLEGLSVEEKIEHILKQVDYLRDLSKEEAFKKDVDHLLSFSRSFGRRVPAFLAHLALQSETDLHDPRAEKVTLMTLHAAKGLEFPVIFICGCEEGLIPYQHNHDEAADDCEERRLFYVGLTRAGEKIFLSRVKKRLLFGKTLTPAPSRFLKDIDQDLKEHETPFSGKKRRDMQLKLF
jgi:uncharacterized protein (TIGR00375 family)